MGVDRGRARRLRRRRRAVGLHERRRQLRRRVVLRRGLADRRAHDRAGGVAARDAGARSRRAGLEHDRAAARARDDLPGAARLRPLPRVNLLSLVLATTALVAVLVRLALTFGQNLRMLQRSRHEALTDGLTGLRNRRALMVDIERVLADAPREQLVLRGLRPRRLQAVQRRVRPPGRRRAARAARRRAASGRSRAGGRAEATPIASAATSSASSRRPPTATRRDRRHRRRGADRARRGVRGRVLVRLGARARRGRHARPPRCGSPTSGCTPTSRAGDRRP